MADILSEAQIGEIQKSFNAVDTDADGIVRTSDLGKLMRLLGQNPTDSELQVSFLFLPTIFWQIQNSCLLIWNFVYKIFFECKANYATVFSSVILFLYLDWSCTFQTFETSYLCPPSFQLPHGIKTSHFWNDAFAISDIDKYLVYRHNDWLCIFLSHFWVISQEILTVTTQ